jgi:Pectate lyase superfamily protein
MSRLSLVFFIAGSWSCTVNIAPREFFACDDAHPCDNGLVCRSQRCELVSQSSSSDSGIASEPDSGTVTLPDGGMMAISSCLALPPGSGVVDVTLPAYGAIPDDGLDDSPAVQKALRVLNEGGTLFFPCGVYQLSGSLRLPQGSSYSQTVLGGNVQKTTLRFTESPDASLRALELANLDNTQVKDLTLEVTRPSADSVGLFMQNNAHVVVENVRLVDLSDSGTALAIDRSGTPTVGFVSQVAIEGFRTGIFSGNTISSVDSLQLKGQRSAGIDNGDGTVLVRNVNSTNTVVAVRNANSGSVLVDRGNLGGGDNASAAVINNKAMFLRQVTSQGYDRLLRSMLSEPNTYRGNDTQVQEVEEYWANGRNENRRGGLGVALPTPETTLQLPFKETPRIFWDPVQLWKSPKDFGGVGNGVNNDTPAFVAALKQSSTVYLPALSAQWRLSGTISIPASVRRIIGFDSKLVAPQGASLEIEAGSSPLVIEGLQLSQVAVSHTGERQLILRHLTGMTTYESKAPPGSANELFLEDVSLDKAIFTAGQRVWANQLVAGASSDGAGAKIQNRGARLSILGLTSRGTGTVLKTEQGGYSDILGAEHIGNGGIDARFVTIDASLSVGLPRSSAFPSYSETRGLQTADAGIAFVQGANGWVVDAMASFSERSLQQLRDDAIIDSEVLPAKDVGGAWTELPAAFPGGYLGRNILYTKEATASLSFRFVLPRDGTYQTYGRWIRDPSGQPHSGHTAKAVYDLGGRRSVDVNQSNNAGAWAKIGPPIPFDAGEVVVKLSNGAGSGVLIGDAVRMLRVGDK